ncbi:MAG: recombinase family protein [Ktedonobacteraceae bacterium]
MATLPATQRRRTRGTLTLETRTKLPTHKPCQVYPRCSTPEQKDNVATEMQQDKGFAIRCGWKDEAGKIIMDTRDLGVSGQLRMEDREAFRDMNRRISNGIIGAVIVRDVARLFRNKWGDEPGKFMEICYNHNVVVVTADFVYDFSISWHIDKFKRKCEESWNYVENHIFGVMLPAMDEQGFAGFWTGGNLPMGYIVDRREKINGEDNPHYNRFIVYEPHARVIRWLFVRFKELGSVRALLREIERLPVLFPDFDESVPEEIVRQFKHYTKVPGGYTIASETGLKNILINRVYIGYWIYQGEVCQQANHEPIVDLNTFVYAYNRLSLTKIDGTPNEDALERQRRRLKKFIARGGLLSECIASDEPSLRIYPKSLNNKRGLTVYYGFYRRGSATTACNAQSLLPSVDIDAIVFAKLLEHMRTPQAESDFSDFTRVEGEVVKEISETLKDIERDLAATKAFIERLKNQAKLGLLTDEDLQKAASESMAAAKAEHERLERRKKDTTQIAREDEERRSYKQLMRDVGDAWDEIVMPEEHPRLVYLFIRRVTLKHLSPRFFTITIVWRDPEWDIDQVVCYKYGNPSLKWNAEEDAILREHFTQAARRELLQMLPRRTYTAIRARGVNLGLSRLEFMGVAEPDVPHRTCWQDWQLMQEYGLTEKQLRSEEGVKIVSWVFPSPGPWLRQL